MTIEATLPHGLQTSVYGSEYKAEYDANLVLLDHDRITSGLLAARPAAGVARRFYFATDQNALYYDNGTAWSQQAISAAAHAGTHGSGGNDALTLAQSQITGLAADLAAKEVTGNKGAANGYAPLDVSAKVPMANIPVLTGVTDGTSAAAGKVGEVITASSTTETLFTASVTFISAVSIELTPGDWDVSALAFFRTNGATVTQLVMGIGTADGDNAAGLVVGDTRADAAVGAESSSATIPPLRVNVSAITTRYLKVYAGYSAGTPKWAGRITARRMR